MIPQAIMMEIAAYCFDDYNSKMEDLEIVRASDEGNSALPKNHDDYAVVTIEVCYDGRHRALYGVSDDGSVVLLAD